MGIELGRISGPLLASNLLRDGVDLQFETDLLYINVSTGSPSIGINTDSPSRTLTVNGLTQTTNLLADDSVSYLSTPRFYISSDRIQDLYGAITISPAGLIPVVNGPRFTIHNFSTSADTLSFTDKVIENFANDSDINLLPDGSGKVIFNTSSVYINGNLHSTGNITFDGNITFGSDNTDSVNFKSDISSSILPDTDNTYDLGTSLKRWANIYVTDSYIGTSTLPGNLIANPLTVNAPSTFEGNITLGNSSADHITFNGLIDNSLIPTTTETYSLGLDAPGNRWNKLFINGLTVDGVVDIRNNEITTLTLDTDLQLSASSTGIVHVSSTDIEITNNLTVDDASTLSTVGITGPLSLTGGFLYRQTGASNRTGNTNITGSLTTHGSFTDQFQDIKIVGNTINTTISNNDLELYADGTGIVKVLASDVYIAQHLDVGLFGYFNNAIVANRVELPLFTVGDLTITSNYIITNTLDRNLELTANGSGLVYAPTNDVNIANKLTALGNLSVDGNTSLKNTVIRSEVSIPFTTNGVQNVASSNGPTGIFFLNGWPSHPSAGLQYVRPGWTVTTIPGAIVTAVGDGTSDETITITGGVFVSGASYAFTGNILSYSPATLTQTGNINQTGNTYITGTFANNNITVLSPSYISVPDIKIEGPQISVTSPNTDLELLAAGSGGIIFDRQLRITNATISNIFDVNDITLSFNNLYNTEDLQLITLEDDSDLLLADTKNDRDLSIIFEPQGTGNFIVNSTTALALVYGNNVDREMEYVGEIRQNKDTKLYEGWTPSGLLSFNNIYDTARKTYITPELTPGENDNTIRFTVNNSVKATISSTELFAERLQGGNVRLTSNVITNLSSSTNVELQPNGTGVVGFNSVYFKDNFITTDADTPLILESTGTGYVKFSGTSGVVFPSGDNASRHLLPELGETRWNTELHYLEIWDGTSWVSATGASNQASLSEVEEIMDIWTLVLG